MFMRYWPTSSCLSVLVRTIGLQEVSSLNKLLFRPATFKSTKITCWKCGAEKALDNFFCNNCSALQEPDANSTYFEVLGMDRKFDLKSAELTKKFRQLQSLVHPDKFSSGPKVNLHKFTGNL